MHFIGCGGVSMSGIIKHLLNCGVEISASDISESSLTRELEEKGVPVTIGHSPQKIEGVDCVVYSQAVGQQDLELNKARELGIKVLRRSQVLGKILSEYENSICIAGSHGKTTATAMIANAFIESKKSPTVFLGGEDYSFGNYLNGDGSVVIAEACEYKKSFLDMEANVSVVLNIDDDHLDCYNNIEDIENSFKSFVGKSVAIINSDDKRASKIFNATTITFGIENNATYTAKNIKEKGAYYSFTACAYGRKLGAINLSILGKHNIYNALATIAVCDLFKLPFSQVKKAIEQFKGVKRRNEYIGKYYNLPCYADYAHHPNEIKATLTAYSKADIKHITVFQPHTYSRTKILMEDFLQVLKGVKPLIIMQTYSAREIFDDSGSAYTLYKNIKDMGNDKVFYAQNEEQIQSLIDENIDKKSQRILFLGAGDVYEKAKNIIVQKNSKKI